MEYAIIILMDDDLDIINNIVNVIIEELNHELDYQVPIRRRNERPRNQDYFEITIPRYTDILFIEHFRMSRRTFEVHINIHISMKIYVYNLYIHTYKYTRTHICAHIHTHICITYSQNYTF